MTYPGALRFIAFRLFHAALVVVAASLLCFALVSMSRYEYLVGLPQDPLLERYWHWIARLLCGDWGVSSQTGEPVLEAIVTRFPVTLQLLGLSIGVIVLLAVPLGVVSALFRDRWIDHLVSGTALLLTSIPSFLLAIVLIFVFATGLEWLPVTRYERFSEDPLANLAAFVLPVLSIALTEWAFAMRVLRAELLIAFQEEFVLLAYAKGLPRWRIVMRHMLRPSSFSLVTVVGLQAGVLLGGVVLIERIFALPGVGRLLFNALLTRDVVVAQGCVLVMAMGVAVIGLAADLLYLRLDPRVAGGVRRQAA